MSDPHHTRIFAFRHVERDKDNQSDPQAPTRLGEIAAYAVGMETCFAYKPTFVSCTSSPQPRAIYTARLFMSGLAGYHNDPMPEIRTDQRLDDYSSDQRTEIKAGIRAGKEFDAQWGVEIEQAVFMVPEGVAAVQIKTAEAMEVVSELANQPGDHLLAGLHGGTIDSLYLELYKMLHGEEIPLGEAGGMFDKVEGWIATFDETGAITALEQIRQQSYLKTLATVLK